MKKYNRIIILSIIIYLGLAFLSGNALLVSQNQQSHAYRVESQRIINQIQDISQVEKIDLRDYQYVKAIDYIKSNVINQNQLDSFYLESNLGQTQILPYYQNNQLQGYLKFTYQLPIFDILHVFLIMQISLFVLELFILIILWYMKKQLIQPFQQLNDLPIHLAKGHFKGEVKEAKSQFFGKFMWSMSQLKDELEVSKKRQLELMKEKKTLLLSLSHDMKTPLNLIQLYSKACLNDVYQTDSQQKHAIEQIEIKSREIEKYIDEIIHSARVDILDLEVHQGEFYLNDLLQNVFSIYNEQCALRQIELIVQSFDNKLLRGDLSRSQEVLENLFENALKYGDGRRIEITFEEEDYCQLIHIFNSGDTVSDSELNHLFESFYRGGNSQGKSGNGLGLYICHELMMKMEGMIYAQKNKDGMMFTLVFQE